jgi:hypothetical protein
MASKPFFVRSSRDRANRGTRMPVKTSRWVNLVRPPSIDSRVKQVVLATRAARRSPTCSTPPVSERGSPLISKGIPPTSSPTRRSTPTRERPRLPRSMARITPHIPEAPGPRPGGPDVRFSEGAPAVVSAEYSSSLCRFPLQYRVATPNAAHRLLGEARIPRPGSHERVSRRPVVRHQQRAAARAARRLEPQCTFRGSS